MKKRLGISAAMARRLDKVHGLWLVVIALFVFSLIWGVNRLQKIVVYTSYPINNQIRVKISSGRYIPDEKYVVFPSVFRDRVKFRGFDLYFDGRRIRYPLGRNCCLLKLDSSVRFIKVSGISNPRWEHGQIFGIDHDWARIGRKPIYEINLDGERVINSEY